MRRKLLLLLAALMVFTLCLSGCKSKETEPASEPAPAENQETEEPEQPEGISDQEAADNAAALIDAIYVQQRTDETDAQCAAAKEAWDALTDVQKELVEGENADPDYFGRDTGDASKDNCGI